MAHIYLSPQLYILVGKVNNFLNIGNHQCIGCDILAYKAVASGLCECQMELAVLFIPVVAKRHAEAVYLLLNREKCAGMLCVDL